MYDKELKEIRKRIFLTGYSASIAHLASAYSIVEILYALYVKKVLKYDPKKPQNEDRDIFILSKGHGSLAYYTILAKVGFFEKDLLKTFSKPGSILGGEPALPHIPGVEATTGSLGHGLSYGVGIALGKKLDNKNNKVYVLLGDGECQEGTIWEAVMFAVHKELNNLVIIVDSNQIQKMGTLKDVMSIDSWKNQFAAFGCNVVETDGHDVDALVETLTKNYDTSAPTVIIANTIKGKGVSIVENDPRWHFKLPSKKELKVFMSELDITEEEVEACKKHM